jgi:hypothetical protein
MTDADALADLDRALAAAEPVVVGIRADRWPALTPCSELDVRGVLNHLVSGDLLFVALVRGQPLPDRNADHLGADPVAAFQRTAAELRERPFCACGWSSCWLTGDLARGTGQPGCFPDDAAERVLAAARQ